VLRRKFKQLFGRSFLLIAICIGGVQAATVPAGFTVETYASGLASPVDLHWAPNGLLFVAEKSGRLRVIENDVLLPTPFIDIRHEVNNLGDRGMLGVTVHPDFPNTPWVYVIYPYDPPETAGGTGNASAGGDGQRVSRLLRYTADITTAFTTAVPDSEVVILGTASTWENIGDPSADHTMTSSPWSCGPDGAFVEDCIPADGN